MIRKLLTTDENAATAILRATLGIVFFAHGAQKLLGWYGGYGLTGTLGFFTNVLHVPLPLDRILARATVSTAGEPGLAHS